MRFKSFSLYIPGIVALVVLVVGFVVVNAFTSPTQAPPGGNVPAPLNVGPDDQTKIGGKLQVFNLWVNNALGVTGGVSVGGNLAKINNIPYSWPTAQGALNTVLTNNGSGTLTWGIVAGGGLWAASGTNISNTNTGGVGIGTTTTIDAPLTVAVNSATAAVVAILENTNTGAIDTGPVLRFRSGVNLRNVGSISALWENGADGTSYLSFATRGPVSSTTEKMRITAAGNVGIGTASPSQKLHVVGNARITAVSGCSGARVLETLADGTLQCGVDDVGAGGMASFDIANTADTTQFTITGGADKLQFTSGAGISIAFDSTNDRVTYTNTGDTTPDFIADDGLISIGEGGTGATVASSARSNLGSAGTGSCAIGSSIRVINSTGVTACEFDDTESGGTTGSGTTNYISKFTGASSIGNSQIFDDGTNVGIGTTNPQTFLHILTTGSTSSGLALRLQNPSTGGFGPVRLEFVSDPVGAANEWIPGYIESGDNGGFTGRLDFFTNGAGSVNKFGSVRAMSIVNGNVGIGTASPTAKLDVLGTINATKLTVGTIDPVYEIDGEKYATYVADVAGGVKTEVTGTINVKSQYVIDFDEQKVGSNLWLFWQTSNKNVADIAALLTSGFDGKVWYEKNSKKNQIILKANQSGEVSFRLTAPRKDAAQWPNEITE